MGTKQDELTCKQAIELMTDYLETALIAPELKRFQIHLASCDRCKTYLEQMRITISTLGRLQEEPVSPRAVEDSLQTFRDWKATRRPPNTE